MILFLKPRQPQILPELCVGEIYNFKDLIADTILYDVSGSKDLWVIFYGFKSVSALGKDTAGNDIFLKFEGIPKTFTSYRDKSQYVFYSFLNCQFIFIEFELWGVPINKDFLVL